MRPARESGRALSAVVHRREHGASAAAEGREGLTKAEAKLA
jgi:hypothetical protein